MQAKITSSCIFKCPFTGKTTVTHAYRLYWFWRAPGAATLFILRVATVCSVTFIRYHIGNPAQLMIQQDKSAI